jgi:hypothetical protein
MRVENCCWSWTPKPVEVAVESLALSAPIPSEAQEALEVQKIGPDQDVAYGPAGPEGPDANPHPADSPFNAPGPDGIRARD